MNLREWGDTAMECRNLPTQERILLAAEKLFAEKGYKETTTREIVREAGASLSSLQAHFQGKENVYFEVRRRAIEELHQIMRPVLDEARYMDNQGLLYGEIVWSLLSEIISKYTEWCFDEERWYAVTLINRELVDGVPIPDLPEKPIAEMFLVMQFLCERYAESEAVSWSAIIGQIFFSSLLSFSGYAFQRDPNKRRNFTMPLSRDEVKYQVKSYILLSLRAYLDIRRKGGEKSAGRESADTVEP